MTLDPAFDKWVWLSFAGLLVVLGIRAWVVESSRTRLASSAGRIRTLTVASAGMVVVVVAMLWVQGGQQVMNSVLNRVDPITGLPLDQPVAPVADPNAPAVDPAAPAAVPVAPAAGNP